MIRKSTIAFTTFVITCLSSGQPTLAKIYGEVQRRSIRISTQPLEKKSLYETSDLSYTSSQISVPKITGKLDAHLGTKVFGKEEITRFYDTQISKDAFYKPLWSFESFQGLISSSINCDSAISSVESDLADGGYYIPWETSLPYMPVVYPEVELSENEVSNSFYGYPPNRIDVIRFVLSGDSTKIYQGIMNSPQLMAAYTSQIVDACSSVGLVIFQHWWEESVQVGRFSDGSTRVFTTLRGGRSGYDRRFVRTVQTSNGTRTLFQWGYHGGY